MYLFIVRKEVSCYQDQSVFVRFLSSSAVKEIARYGGEISYMVPKIIEKDIAERLKIK